MVEEGDLGVVDVQERGADERVCARAPHRIGGVPLNKRRELERWGRRLEVAVDDGDFVQPKRVLTGDWCQDWLVAMKAQIRPSTWESYERNLRVHVIPRIGAIKLQQLAPTHLDKLYAELLSGGRRPGKGNRANKGRGLSPRTVSYIAAIIHHALQDATRKGLVVRNVAELADRPKQDPDEKANERAEEMHTWTAAELRSFLELIQDDRREWFYPVVLTAATTGMRRGEVLGLRWRDVDLDAGRASVRQTIVCVKHEICFSKPKTKTGKRSVSLEPRTVAMLRAHQKVQKLSKAAYTQDHDLVFAAADGGPLDPESVSLVFERRVRRSGLPRISFHELRHTWATLALESGVPLKVVSEILGHANISITGDIYSHVRPAMQEDATTRVAAVVFGA